MVRIKTVLNLFVCVISLLGFIPLFPYLDNVARILFPLALVTGIVAEKKNSFFPSRITTVSSVLLFVYYLSRFSLSNPVSPTVNLLIVLLAVRLSSDKTGRNYLQIFALSFFALASSSLFSLDMIFLLYLLAMLVLIALALVILTFFTEGKDVQFSWQELRKVILVAWIMPIIALPLMLLFFVILPRTQLPLWDFLNKGRGGETGLTDTVRPGSNANVEGVKNVIFRVGCDKIPNNHLYWRGIVLNHCEENGWSRKDIPDGEKSTSLGGVKIRQTIFPEPALSSYLPALNLPVQVTGVRNIAAKDLVFVRGGTRSKRLKYEALSVLSDTIKVTNINTTFYLQIPAEMSRRIKAKGTEIARTEKNDQEKLAAVERFIHLQKLTYATTNLPVGKEPLEQFLFEKKRGNCEFFASSCALLLRVSGVPSRLVGGYYGGIYNEVAGYYVVSEDMAHVWVEAYINGKGWVTLDPSGWSVNFAGPAIGANQGILKRIALYFDAMGYYWTKIVVTYDLEKQFQLFQQANFHSRQLALYPSRMLKPVIICLILFAAVTCLRFLLRRPLSREEIILKRFIKELQRNYPYLKLSGNYGLYELTERIENVHVKEFVRIYGAAVYRDRRLSDVEYTQLVMHVNSMKTGSER
jgi:hypothetical protein